jgi:hypothetical protein
MAWHRWRAGRAEERERTRGREHGSRKRQGDEWGGSGGKLAAQCVVVAVTTTAGQGGVGKYHSWQPLLASLLQHFFALNLPLPPPHPVRTLHRCHQSPLFCNSTCLHSPHDSLSLSLPRGKQSNWFPCSKFYCSLFFLCGFVLPIIHSLTLLLCWASGSLAVLFRVSTTQVVLFRDFWLECFAFCIQVCVCMVFVCVARFSFAVALLSCYWEPWSCVVPLSAPQQ